MEPVTLITATASVFKSLVSIFGNNGPSALDKSIIAKKNIEWMQNLDKQLKESNLDTSTLNVDLTSCDIMSSNFQNCATQKINNALSGYKSSVSNSDNKVFDNKVNDNTGDKKSNNKLILGSGLLMILNFLIG